MQAIVVKYLGATDTKGSRYKAVCQAGSLTVGRDYELNGDRDAARVAAALRDRLGWVGPQYGELIQGTLPNGDYVFVFSVGDVVRISEGADGVTA